MTGISPWIPVYPAENSEAILGNLPMKPVSVPFQIPTSVVPSDATGILVFAWCAITGNNPDGGGYWHMAVNVPGGGQNFFSLIVVGSPNGDGATVFNSEAFWLPMPSDGQLTVTYAGSPLRTDNQGEVEIHGYVPGASTARR